MVTLVIFTAFILAMLIGLMFAALDAQFSGK